MAVKKQSADWSSSGWDADDSWSNEKEGQGQSSVGEEGWGNDWGEEDTDTTLANTTTLPLPEGVRLASEYDWDSNSSASKGAGQNDLFASVSQRNTAGTAATQSADWSSSGWDADDSWSNEKEGQGQSSASEEGWGNDWAEEDTDTTLANTTTLPLPEGVRLASEYNWDSNSSASKGAGQNDLFASVSQRTTAGTAATTGDGWFAKATGDWGAEESWESVDGNQGLSKAELSKKKREERRKELEAKRVERKAAKGPLKLGARKLD